MPALKRSQIADGDKAPKITVYMHPDSLAVFREMVEAKGVSISRYVRDMIEHDIDEYLDETLPEENDD